MEFSIFPFIYFSVKGLSVITAYFCGKPEVALWFLKTGDKFGFRMRVVFDTTAPPTLQASAVGREGVLLDPACAFTSDIILQASSNRGFNHRHTWLLFDDSPFNQSYVEEVLPDNIKILPDADVLWASPDALVEVYRVKPGTPLLVSHLGVARNISKKVLMHTWAQIPSKTDRRKNLQNISLSSALVVSQPQYFKGWSDVSNRYVDTWPKLTYPLMLILGQDLNLRNRYNLFQVDLYGEQHNGSFDGLAGLLQRGKIEIGICSMFMRNDRWQVMHYSSEVTDLKGAFMFRQPSQSTVSNMFLLPFSKGVWAASITIFSGVAVLLALICKRLLKLDPTLEQFTPMETITFAVGTICQQGFYATPFLASIRIVIFFTLTTSVFVFTSYSAKIVAILQSPSNAIQTIEDLTRSPMSVGVQETTYKKTYFAESTEPATQALYRKKLLPLGEGAYMSAVEGIERMRTGLFAFQAEENSGYDVISKTFTESEKCGLKQIQAFKLPMVAVPIRKLSGYRELIAVRLRWHREAGLFSQQKRIWLAERPRCDSSAGGGFVSVGLRDVTPAAQALLLGHAAAALILAAELLLRRYTERRNRKVAHIKEKYQFNVASR